MNFAVLIRTYRANFAIKKLKMKLTLDPLLQDSPKYWTDGSYDDWLGEMAGARLIIERFANITDGSVIGVRAPYLRVGGNVQFEMMADQASKSMPNK
jgi:hypothetical protein